MPHPAEEWVAMSDEVERAAHRHGSGTRGQPRQRVSTDLRLQILRAIEDYWSEQGRPPTIREIGKAVGIKATSYIAHHVNLLVRQGLLNRVPGSRGLLPTQPAGLCALGTLAAGDPLDLFDP